MYPLVALSTTELDISRAASIEPEKVGIESDRGARERRSKRFSVSPNIIMVGAGRVKYRMQNRWSYEAKALETVLGQVVERKNQEDRREEGHIYE